MTKEQVEWCVKGIREMADFCNSREGCCRYNKEGKIIDKCPMYDEEEPDSCSTVHMFNTIIYSNGKFQQRVKIEGKNEAE